MIEIQIGQVYRDQTGVKWKVVRGYHEADGDKYLATRVDRPAQIIVSQTGEALGVRRPIQLQIDHYDEAAPISEDAWNKLQPKE